MTEFLSNCCNELMDSEDRAVKVCPKCKEPCEVVDTDADDCMYRGCDEESD